MKVVQSPIYLSSNAEQNITHILHTCKKTSGNETKDKDILNICLGKAMLNSD